MGARSIVIQKNYLSVYKFNGAICEDNADMQEAEMERDELETGGNSFYAKALAVKRVVTNKDKKTDWDIFFRSAALP